MSEDDMIKCLIAFILGWLIARMMGNGFSVGADLPPCRCPPGQFYDTLLSPPKCVLPRRPIGDCFFDVTQYDEETCNSSYGKMWGGARKKCSMQDNWLPGTGGRCSNDTEACDGECLNGEDHTKCTYTPAGPPPGPPPGPPSSGGVACDPDSKPKQRCPNGSICPSSGVCPSLA